MKFAHVREANISHLQSKYFIAKRFHLPEWANFVAHLLYRRCAVGCPSYAFLACNECCKLAYKLAVSCHGNIIQKDDVINGIACKEGGK